MLSFAGMENEARIARHLDWLAELGTLAMAIARRTGKEAAEDEASPAQVLSFDRAARAVRSNIEAEAKLVRDHTEQTSQDRMPSGRGRAPRRKAQPGALTAILSNSWAKAAVSTGTDRLDGVTLADIVEEVCERAGVQPDFYGWSDEEMARPFVSMQPSSQTEAAAQAAEDTAPDASGHDPP